MKSNYKQLGQFIRQVDVRNAAGKEENLLGVFGAKNIYPVYCKHGRNRLYEI